MDDVVTIGLPFHNCVGSLRNAVRSVFAQTHQKWRLLLVDDGSTDGSLALATSVRDQRVSVLSDGKRRGLIQRLNQIASLTDTEFLARMDGDDCMHPERMARQLAAFKNDPVDVLGTAAYSVDEIGRIRGVRGGTISLDPRTVIAHGLYIHPTVMGRTAWFRSNPYRENCDRAEDRELWCRTLRTTIFGNLAEPLLFYFEPRHLDLTKYIASARTDRTIIRMYAGAYGARSMGLVATSHFKVLIYRCAQLCGCEETLIRRRNRALDPDQLSRAMQALETIRATPVPGW